MAKKKTGAKRFAALRLDDNDPPPQSQAQGEDKPNSKAKNPVPVISEPNEQPQKESHESEVKPTTTTTTTISTTEPDKTLVHHAPAESQASTEPKNTPESATKISPSDLMPDHSPPKPVSQPVNSTDLIDPKPSNSNDGQPKETIYKLIRRKNNTLMISVLELQISQCRNLILIDRLVNGQVNDPNNGEPSYRQKQLRSKIEGLETRLAQLKAEPSENRPRQ
ncbi:hypothetical protein TWF730_003009 [Orbilia blumenaviensis]|uniref:Uncharacterized protein n=1 Tax=Orbilia blumenaviensis TaxID=1796055 RepID=A0AAV9U8K9_9PEZI